VHTLGNEFFYTDIGASIVSGSNSFCSFCWKIFIYARLFSRNECVDNISTILSILHHQM